jgi:hypothetical protein
MHESPQDGDHISLADLQGDIEENMAFAVVGIDLMKL